jgi:hypothetical protein
MPQVSANQHDSTNYSFKLKCLAAITATAVIAAGITAGIMAAIAANHTIIVVATSSSKALALAALTTSASVAANILLPVLGAVLLIGVIGLLAYSCFANNRSSTIYVDTPSRPCSNWWSSGSNRWFPFFSGPHYARNSSGFNQHGHSSAAPYRSAHAEHQHGHSGSTFFESAPTGHQHGNSGAPISHSEHSAVHSHS